MAMPEFVRKHPRVFHSLSALVGGSVSSVCLGFSCIPLYQWLFEFNLAEAVYLTSMTFFLVFMLVFISSFAKKNLRAIWTLNLALSAGAILIYLVQT